VQVRMLAGHPGGDIDVEISGPVWEGVVRIPMPGLHQALNVATAIASLALAGGDPKGSQIERAVREVELPDGRWRLTRRGSFQFVDDAYNANPTSVRASLDAFLAEVVDAGPKVVVIGEMLELGPEAERYHRELAHDVGTKPGLDAIIFVGAFAESMRDAARESGSSDCAAVHAPADAAVLIRSFKAATVLLKASRGVRLERILEEFETDGKCDVLDH
jgi:UDP-N-acetylmuramyl pentapeptide synthase